MTSLFSEESFSALFSESPKMGSQIDDAASTASGASSDSASVPSSPGMSEPATGSPMSSPMKISASPDTPICIDPESLKDLPSLGSLGHFAGLCSRCCFHAKGRCQNGYNCRFCHFDHEKRQRKKKIDRDVRGLPAAPVHRQLESRAFYNQAWGMSSPQNSQYVSAPPGLELPCAPPPPASYPVVNLPAPMPPPQGPPTPPPALPAPASPPPAAPPALVGIIEQPLAEAPLSEACVEIPACAVVSANSVEDWTVEKVVDWLTAAGLGHLTQSFEEHRITGDVLLELNSSDLEEIGIRAFGDKKRLLRAVVQLQASVPVAQAPCPPPPPSWQAPLLETTSPWGAFSMPPLTPPPSYDA